MLESSKRCDVGEEEEEERLPRSVPTQTPKDSIQQSPHDTHRIAFQPVGDGV